MEAISVFYLDCQKKLIFRKEGDKFIVFDPIDLEFYQLNYFGAEIFYLISRKSKKDEIIKHFIAKYDTTNSEVEDALIEFIMRVPFIEIMRDNLKELDII